MIPDWAGYCQHRPDFGEVIDERYHSLIWLDGEVLSGRVQFWRSDNAALITELKSYPTGARDIHVVIAVGDMGEIIEVLAPIAEQFGRDNGCVAATVESRVGWARALRPSGYEMHQAIVRKELQDGPQ